MAEADDARLVDRLVDGLARQIKDIAEDRAAAGRSPSAAE
jgi:hypothetical protein